MTHLDRAREIPEKVWREAVYNGLSFTEMQRRTGIDRKIIRQHLAELGIFKGNKSTRFRWQASGLSEQEVRELLKTKEGRTALQSVTGYSYRQIEKLDKQFREKEAEMDIPKVREFVKLARMARTIANSEGDWWTKYDLIFSEPISGTISALGITFDWKDEEEGPNASIISYVAAINEKADELLDTLEEA